MKLNLLNHLLTFDVSLFLMLYLPKGLSNLSDEYELREWAL
jgi:hypothetical protein